MLPGLPPVASDYSLHVVSFSLVPRGDAPLQTGDTCETSLNFVSLGALQGAQYGQRKTASSPIVAICGKNVFD